MKKLLFTIFLVLALFPLKNAFATVGGPHSFTDFYYQSSTNEIFAFKDHGDGSGCQELLKFSINTNKLTNEISCNDYMSANDGDKKIQDRKKSLEASSAKLKEVDLKKINITFKSKLASGNFFEKDGKVKKDLDLIEGDPGFWFSSYHINWSITPTIDKKEKMSFTAPTCVKKPPINLTGLASTKHNFLVIVATSISQCYEYGYPNDTISVIENVPIQSSAFLGKYNPGYIQDKNDLKIKPMAGKFYLSGSLQSVLYYLNNTGFQAYKEGSYASAMYFFKEAYTDKYLLPLFSLAATKAKVGKTDASFKDLDKLLSYKSTRDYYLGKIAKDSDFDKMRKDKRYIKYFVNYTPPKTAVSSTNTTTKPVFKKPADTTAVKTVKPVKTSINNQKNTNKPAANKNMLYLVVIIVLLGILFASKKKK